MVRCSLACPHTVASIILIKVIRFLGLSPNCGRVLEDSVSTAIETATISFDKKPLRDMENPLSEPKKSVVRIGAIRSEVGAALPITHTFAGLNAASARMAG